VSLSDLVEQQVLARPGAIAVKGCGGVLTYRELSRAADRLAARLAVHGVGPGHRVVVGLRPGPDLVTVLVAVVRTGAAYVPVDCAHPVHRRRLVVDACGARAVVTETAFAADYDGCGAVIVAVDEEPGPDATRPGVLPPALPAPEDAAFVGYTRGTTGAPAGVVVPHRAVLDLVTSAEPVRLTPDDVVAQAANRGCDAGTFEIWAALCAGATLVPLAEDTVVDAGAFERAVVEHGITVMFLTTSLFHRVADERPAAFAPLRTVLFGGERCDARRVRRVLRAGPPGRLLHVYGPTEATAFATWYEVRGAPSESERTVPIGRPAGAASAVVVDEAGGPVGPGGSGELLLGGPGLATGYLGLPRLTAERFVADRFTAGGGRLYRTGDRVLLREDGNLELVGRMDGQVPQAPGGEAGRTALPAPSFDAGRPGAQPGTPVQEIVRDLFAEVLGVPRRVVHADSDFFRLGGHSLSAARLLSRVHQIFGTAPGGRALYDASTPVRFARLLGDRPAVATGPVGSGTDSAVLPLRLRGDLDRGALAEALVDLGRRHEALRNSRLGAAGTRLVNVAADEHVLELAVPAADVDQWSQLPLAADLALAYGARATGDADLAPAAYGEVPRARWGEAAPTPLPGAGEAPCEGLGGEVKVRLDALLHARLTRFAAGHGVTLFMVVHAALAALLTELGAGERITVAAPVPARDSAALRGAVGPYGRVLALQVDTSGGPAFTELLERVRAACLAAYRDGDAPLAGPGGVALTVLQQADEVYEAAGLSVRPEPARLPCARAGLAWTLVERQDAVGAPSGIEVTGVFAVREVGEAVAASLTGQLVSVLEAALDDAGYRIGGRRPGSGAGADGWSGEALRLPRATVAGLFAERVGRGPGRPALAGADRAELDARSDLLAHVLVEHQVGPGSVVATAVASPAGFAVAALAIAKAGAVCLPLDPVLGVPEGVRPLVLLLDEAADRVLPAAAGATRLVRDPAADQLAAGGRWPVRDRDRVRPLSPEDPLVLGTSGDGVVVVGAESVVAEGVSAPAGRGAAAWLVGGYPDADATLGLLGALVSGTPVVVPDPSLRSRGAAAVLRWMRKQGAGVVLGGGRDRELLALARAEGLALTKSGGTVEGRLVVEHGPGDRTRPARGYRVYVLDAAMRPVAPGATGALYVAGAGVARGYAGRPGATGERFVPDPFGGAQGTARMWRTGRSARVDAEGELRVLDEPWEGDPYTDATATFVVVCDDRGHRALWPAAAVLPPGWRATHTEDLYDVCLDRLNAGRPTA
jgi:amino acid adenylation domain-containing protein